MNALISKLREERDSIKESIKSVCDSAATENRDLSEVEDKNLADLATRLEALNARLEQLEKIELRNSEAADLSAKVDAKSGEKREAQPVHVTNEPLTYNERSDHSIVVDAFRAQFLNDFSAQARLNRHMAEMEVEHRAVNTGAFTGLVVPQYLTSQFVPLQRAGRVVANQLNHQALPPNGMSIQVGRLTTGTAVAAQATENATVQNTDSDDTLLSVPVVTVAGQQDISRQAVERGYEVDQLLFGDLAGAYAVALDAQVINGTGTGGTMLGILNTAGINAITYTDATPTVPELYSKLADAIQQVNSNRFLPATAIFMHPRRWGWFTAAVDTANRPLVVPAAGNPMNAVASGDIANYGYVGQIMGLPAFTDANIPTNLGAGTNEDRIIITRTPDLVLWENGDGQPFQFRFDQTNAGSLQVKLVVYGYAAFTAGRYPQATSVVAGTGLITPVF